MPKTPNTPRDELVCGKLDVLERTLATLTDVVPDSTMWDLVRLVADIRHDCERMEAKLFNRRTEVETLQARAEAAERERDALRERVASLDYSHMGPAYDSKGKPMEDMAVIRLDRIARIGDVIDAARTTEREGQDETA